MVGSLERENGFCLLLKNESLVKFLENEIPGFTSGMSVFRSLIEQYNYDQNARGDSPELEIQEDLPMADYMELPVA